MSESKGRTDRVTVRLSEEDLDSIQIVAERAGLESVSDVLRTALDLFIETQATPAHVRTVVVHLPAGLYSRAERLVLAGEALSVEHEIEKALEAHLSGRMEKLIFENRRIEKIEQLGLQRTAQSSLDENLQP